MKRLLLTALVALAVCEVAALPRSILAAQDRFKTAVGVVTMNVAVRRNYAPVIGLTAADFRLTDSGIEQPVNVALAGSRPADLTLLIDTSGSMDGTMEDMRRHVVAIARQLRADDRIRLLTFADDVREVFSFRPGSSSLPLDALMAGGWTALYDALGLAFIHQPAPDRSHLIVVFSDAIDSSSTIDLNLLKELTRRSEAVLHGFIERPRPANVSRRVLPSRERPPLPPMHALVDLTGGYTTFMAADDDVPGAFREALADFRQRYVLTYAIPEPLRAGWHEVNVTIKRPGHYDVGTRRGYVQ